MATAGRLWVALGSNPAARVLGWLMTGASWPHFDLALALKAVDGALQKFFRAAVHAGFVHGHRFGARTTWLFHCIMPSLRPEVSH